MRDCRGDREARIRRRAAALGRDGALPLPRAGAVPLIARAPGLFSASAPVLDAIFELQPENREWDSNRLTRCGHPAARRRGSPRAASRAPSVDSAGNRPGIDAIRPALGRRLAPERAPGPVPRGRSPLTASSSTSTASPAETIPAMLRVWEGGRRVTLSASCPIGSGPPWSLPLVPGWRELAGHAAAGDRHRAVASDDGHPARRPRGPAAGALVRHRLQVAAQRSPARARADLRVRRDRSRPRTSPGRSARLRDQLAVSGADEAGEVPDELPRASAAHRSARRALARAARPPDDSAAQRASGRRRRTRRCGASTRRASPSS